MKKKHWKQHVTTVILSATLFLVLIFMSGKLGMVAYASDKICGEVGTLKWYLEEQKDVVDEKEQVETALVIKIRKTDRGMELRIRLRKWKSNQ